MRQIEFGKKTNCPIVVCLGYFGCMHLGHVELVRRARTLAEQLYAKTALFTFSNNHLALLGRESKVLYTFDERLSLYESIGTDYVLSARFDDSFRRTTGEEFVRRLCEYPLRGVVCGFDYSCGSDRLDGVRLKELLKDICPVEIVEPICVNGSKISTTLVRSLLADNRIREANALLCEPFFVSGKVVHGRNVGSALGFPTANIATEEEKFVPTGVYGGRAEVDGKGYKAIVNIGGQPTFGEESVTVEAHLSGFHGDLYGRNVKLSLTEFLRPTCKFETAEQLAEQLKKDLERVFDD